MKKPCQIEAQRAVKQLEAMAAEGNPAVQMVLPMAEMMGWLRKGVGELIRQATTTAPWTALWSRRGVISTTRWRPGRSCEIYV